MQETREGRPQGELTTESDRQQDRSWYDRPHEEIVAAVREYIQHWNERSGGHWTPEFLIQTRLHWEASGSHLPTTASKEEIKAERLFTWQIEAAWDALAFDRYEPSELMRAENRLHQYWMHFPESTIKLTNSRQVKIIDALADAVGIPHQRHSAEIPVPKQLQGYKNYEKWLMPHERRQRTKVDKAS